MRLVDLEPEFVRYRTDTGPSGVRQILSPAANLAEAQGVMFLCPVCFARNGGSVGTHLIAVTFHGRGATDDQGSRGRGGQPSRWHATGSSAEDLTLTPSIDLGPGGCGWHGFITNGDVRGT